MSGSGSSSAGTSKIELDSKLLNSLLSIFVNKPGGLQVQLGDQGNLQVHQGDLQVGVDPFLISQALKVHLRNGNLGPFTVQLNQLQMGPQGLTLSLNLLT